MTYSEKYTSYNCRDSDSCSAGSIM